jgi:23S rRNA (cytidine1920-2'-O)/16S rRNA (cytidine1409-2'-O)-methyltransferase
MGSDRLDIELLHRGLARSRTAAQTLIKENKVLVNGVICNIPNKKILPDDEIIVTEKQKYVSRGGDKLSGAIEVFNINVEGLDCIDVGSSTGGFTDCLLQHGVKHVTAVDVGRDQFDKSLLEKNIDKISLFEGVDIREFRMGTSFDILVCDASFISVRLLVESFYRLLKVGGLGIILIKPQFEVGRGNTKKGIVREVVLREQALADAVAEFEKHNFTILGTRLAYTGRRWQSRVFCLNTKVNI